MSKPILSNSVRIYTAVWGNKYLNLLKDTLLRSFKWPLNLEAIRNEKTTWSIHTKEEDIGEIEKLSKLLPVDNVEIYTIDKAIKRQGEHVNMGAVLLESFTHEIEKSIEEDSKILIAPPDSIFGDGTLENLFTLGEQKGVCVAVAHPRVIPSIFKGLGSPLHNSKLVSLAFDNLHTTWTEAELSDKFINSYVGGVVWQRVEENLYRVQHRLPTCYLIHFDKSDLDFYKKQICFGAIDHTWPTKLFPEERIRYVGSSDMCFICEVTAPCQNIPPKYPVDKTEPDRFWRNAYHNQMFRQFFVTYRGD